MTGFPSPARYDSMIYRTCGASGLKLPVLSLGLWHNFGDSTPISLQRELLRTAFDAGISHFDLANNYGPPAGSAEINFGRLLHQDFAAHRDELLISTKAGYDLWPGPYGRGGSRKHLLASLDRSLRQLRLDHVDIFYSHRYDASTPLAETAAALADVVRQGKARYIGISSYSPGKTAEMAALLRNLGVPLLIHQPSYNLLNRWVEQGLLQTLATEGMGCIGFSALAQGLLTDKYLAGVPADARINRPGGGTLKPEHLSEQNLLRVCGLDAIATARGQSLAQMALAWVLRDPRVTSALIGASSSEQIRQNVAALSNLDFSGDELAAIDQLALDGGLDLWRRSATDQAF